MSVISANPKAGHSRSISSGGGVKETVAYLVRTDNPDDTAATVLTGQGFPKFGETLDGSLFVTSLDATQDPDARTVWTVTLGLEARGRWDEAEQSRPDPIDWSPKVRRSTIKSVESIDYDVYGVKLQNVNNQDFDPPLTADRSHLGYTITRYVRTPDDPLYEDYMDSVNSDTWFNYPPGIVRIDSIECDQVKVGNYSVYQETWQLIVLRGKPLDGELQVGAPVEGGYVGHRLRVANRGTIAENPAWLAGTDPTRFIPILKDGTPVTSPVDLTFSGEDASNAAEKKTYWLLFQPYKSLPFGPLGF